MTLIHAEGPRLISPGFAWCIEHLKFHWDADEDIPPYLVLPQALAGSWLTVFFSMNRPLATFVSSINDESLGADVAPPLLRSARNPHDMKHTVFDLCCEKIAYEVSMPSMIPDDQFAARRNASFAALIPVRPIISTMLSPIPGLLVECEDS